MTRLSIACLAGLSLLALSFQAAADQGPDPRIYVAPMFSMAFNTSSDFYPADDLGGAQISVGKNFGPYFAIELYGFYFDDTQLGDRYGYAANMDTFGYGASALFFPARDLLPIYTVVGAGLGQNDFDGLTSLPDNSQDSNFFDIGAGFFVPLGDTGLKLRAEYRYRSADVDASGGGEYSFRNNIVSVGLQIPLGEAPQQPEPVTPTPAPEPETAPVHSLDTDLDNDGVIDAADQCPMTTKGVPVNDNGCIITKQASIVLRGVTFEFNSAQLTAQAEDRLTNVISALKATPKVTFSIAGYTDSVGSKAYNQELSERRAQSVKTYLVEHGIDPSRITSVTGYGEAHPVATNETEAGRAQNRRVELHVTSQ